jgi:DNA-binding HxlR family transcriptional regulator
MYSMEGMKRCHVDNTFKIIGKKFTVLIVRNMMSNQTRFNQFIESIEGMNPKTLSTRLKEMEKNGLIHRKIYHETPIRIEYYLIEKGKHLKSILEVTFNSSNYLWIIIHSKQDRSHTLI